MNIVERESVQYAVSQDELMLEELERRDGIYSFIFHELERPREQSAEHCTTADQVIIVSGTDSSQYHSNLNRVSHTPHTSTSMCASHLHIEPVCATDYLANANHLSKSPTTTFTATALEYSRVRSSCLSNNSLTSLSSSYRLLAHSKFYDFLASNVIRVRIPTPRLSHVYAPLVRNRRHVLKETLEYTNFELNIKHTPDLRALFPVDPDVHAPFAKKHRNCADDPKTEKEIVKAGLPQYSKDRN